VKVSTTLGYSAPFDRRRCKPSPAALPDGIITRSWAFGDASGKAVKVAVIDTGVDGSHPAIGKVHGYARITEKGGKVRISHQAHDDAFGHGTAIAGIIRSFAPECEIYSVRVIGENMRGSGEALIKGITWAMEHGCRVCNLSLGTTDADWFASLHRLMDSVYFKNIVAVAAANNLPVPSFPSVFAGVVSVASHGLSDPEHLLYNVNPPAEFGARGIRVRVPWLNQGYILSTGNSYAAPHVSGFVARILGAHPHMTPAEVKAVLKAIANNTVP
jgi:subtilisin family serine protease